LKPLEGLPNSEPDQKRDQPANRRRSQENREPNNCAAQIMYVGELPEPGRCGHLVSIILTLLFVSGFLGCATTGRHRILLGVASGSTLGGLAGAALSPNPESQTLNALVFGLSGALAGGAFALITDQAPPSNPENLTLKDREGNSGGKSREFIVHPDQELPSFLKSRVQPVVIEEYVESDRVSEEGTLHEPHKAYRIKRSAELFAKPVPSVTPYSGGPR
jgi:hypothetical protein